MNQITMFDLDTTPARYDDMPEPAPVARARRSDPESSKAAAAEMNASGAARVQRERVIDLVFRYPGKTSRELAKLDGELDRHAVARRLPEAEAAGEIHRRSAGTAELTWHPGGKQ